MNEETRKGRTLDVLERLRMLREHEMGVRVVDEEGSLLVRPVGEG